MGVYGLLELSSKKKEKKKKKKIELVFCDLGDTQSLFVFILDIKQRWPWSFRADIRSKVP